MRVDVVTELNRGDPVLGSADAGRRATDALRRRLDRVANRDTVWLDFQEASVAAFPWLEALLVAVNDHWVEWVGGTHLLSAVISEPDVALSIDAALRARNLVMRSGAPGETGSLLGADARRLSEVYAAAVRRDRFTTADLRDELGRSGEAINAQVRRLFRAGVLARVPAGYGREFFYWALPEHSGAITAV